MNLSQVKVSPRFVARRTLYDLGISCLITSDQRKGKVIRDFCADCA